MRDLAALAEHTRAVGIFELDEVMIKNLAVAFGIAHLPSAHALGANWMRPFNPVTDVNVMNVLLDNVVTGEPREIIPVSDLVMEFGLVRETFDAELHYQIRNWYYFT